MTTAPLRAPSAEKPASHLPTCVSRTVRSRTSGRLRAHTLSARAVAPEEDRISRSERGSQQSLETPAPGEREQLVAVVTPRHQHDVHEIAHSSHRSVRPGVCRHDQRMVKRRERHQALDAERRRYCRVEQLPRRRATVASSASSGRCEPRRTAGCPATRAAAGAGSPRSAPDSRPRRSRPPGAPAARCGVVREHVEVDVGAQRRIWIASGDLRALVEDDGLPYSLRCV